MEKKITYFEKVGKMFNTEETLKLAKERAEELGIKTIVLASSTGYTARKALKALKDTDLRLVVVGTSRELFSEDLLKTLKDKGIPVRFSHEVEYSYPESVMNAFRKLCEGLKVVVDLGMVTAEEGLVSGDEEIVAIAGTGPIGFKDGGGADTAAVMIPQRSDEFYKLQEKTRRRYIKEIICKPR